MSTNVVNVVLIEAISLCLKFVLADDQQSKRRYTSSISLMLT